MADTEPVPSFRRLRAFDATVRARSLSGAALALRLSQPALTHSIAQLEADVGTRLFERGPEGAFLTAAGRVFEIRALRFFAQLRQALATAAGRGLEDPVLDVQEGKLASAQVRSLLAIWRAGSFRAAARALGLAEPSLQRPARDLEKVVGAPLYRRTALGLTVNETGAEFARQLALAIGEIRSGAEEIGTVAQTRPSLRIGVLALAPRILIARAAGPLLTGHAGQRIEVVEGPYVQIAQAVHDGALDLAFGALRAPAPFPDLVEEPFFEDPYVIACRRDHPLTRKTSLRTSELSGHDWVHPTADLPRRAVLDRLTAAWGLSGRVQFETNCLSTITALLATSDRLSILSRWHIALDGRLAPLDSPAVPHEPRHVGMTCRANWLPTPFQSRFLDRLRRASKIKLPLSASSELG